MVERMDQLSYLIPVELFLKYFSIDSSNVNEVISLILNFFFLRKDFTRTASTKRTLANKNKKGSVFMLLKNMYGEKSHLFDYLRFCSFV